MTWDYAAFAPRSQEEGSNINFKDLSPELREKAKACKTPDEMLALAKQEGYKLSPFFLHRVDRARRLLCIEIKTDALCKTCVIVSIKG